MTALELPEQDFSPDSELGVMALAAGCSSAKSMLDRYGWWTLSMSELHCEWVKLLAGQAAFTNVLGERPMTDEERQDADEFFWKQ